MEIIEILLIMVSKQRIRIKLGTQDYIFAISNSQGVPFNYHNILQQLAKLFLIFIFFLLF